MGNLVNLRPHAERTATVGHLLARVMAEARHRAGLDEREWAAALNDALGRDRRSPGITPAAVRAYESGQVPPRSDVLCLAMIRSGTHVEPLLKAWLRPRNRGSSTEAAR